MKVLKKLLCLLLGSIAMCSCMVAKNNALQQSNIIGIYKWSLEHDYGYSIIELDSENKFKYVHNEGLLENLSSGNWIFDGEEVVLNSTAKNDYNGIVKESIDKNIKETIIKVIDWNGVPYKFLSLDINNKIIVTDSFGTIKIPSQIKTIYSRFYYEYEFYYLVHDPNSNVILIQLIPQSNSNIFFVNKRLGYKKNKLVEGDKTFYRYNN